MLILYFDGLFMDDSFKLNDINHFMTFSGNGIKTFFCHRYENKLGCLFSVNFLSLV